jgi:5-methylcytosine-specific restriction endonuclease McrA
LVVKECIGKGNRSDYRWKCHCDCGNDTFVDTSLLKRHRVKSCGCLATETTVRINKQRSGPNHPFWNPNITSEERIFRKTERKWSSPRLNRWRNKVYAQDNYTCQKCKDSCGGNLNAHHICSWAYYPRLRYMASNGITLCRGCHKDFHNKFGRRKNTRKQITEFLR